MLVKFISLATLICSAVLYSLNAKSASDTLFFIVSGGVLVCALRLAFAAVLVVASFARLPAWRPLKITLSIFGLPLIIFGVAGFLTNSFDYSWYGFIKPLDFLLFIETGIIMNVLALEPQRQTVHFEQLPSKNRTLIISAFGLHTQKLKHAA